MLKKITITSLLLIPFLSLAQIPNDIKITYKGPTGTSSTMTFKRQGNNYTAELHFNTPIYKMVFVSNGLVKGNQLVPLNYKDTRNNALYAFSQYDYKTNKVYYGKSGEKKSQPINGATYDVLSMPWQISFNPNLTLSQFQTSTGKGIYNVRTNKIAINSIKSTKNLKIKQENTPVNIYNLQSIKGNKAPVKFGYSTKYNNLPVYIDYENNYTNAEFFATSITVDGKKIF